MGTHLHTSALILRKHLYRHLPRPGRHLRVPYASHLVRPVSVALWHGKVEYLAFSAYSFDSLDADGDRSEGIGEVDGG